MGSSMDSGMGVSLLGARDTRALAAELGITPTKRLGQNFVIDPNTVERIVRVADVRPGETVLEVGPGLGSLTLALAQAGADVIAIELDPALAARLPQTFAERAPGARLDVVRADALRVSREDVLAHGTPTLLVANLPYNVSVPVLLHLLELLPELRGALVMVQKEVADRLAAPPGSRTYGIPSAKAAWYGSVESAGNVGRHVFWPEPNVDSGLVRVTRRPAPVTTATREQVFSVVDAAFSQRRKTLRSALAALAGGAAAADAVLEAAAMPPMARGEQLGIDDFIRIAEALAAQRNPAPAA